MKNKIIIIIGVFLTLLSIFFYSENTGNVGDLLIYPNIENNFIKIIESFQDGSNSIEISTDELKDFIAMLSEIKYRKTFKNNSSKTTQYSYEIYYGDQEIYPFISIDDNGITIIDGEISRYSLKNKDVEMIVSQLQIIFDNNLKIANTISKVDYEYVYNTPASEISFRDLLEDLNIDINESIFESFSVSISRTGYIESFVVTMYSHDSMKMIKIKYNRLEEKYNIFEMNNISETDMIPTDNQVILSSIDYLVSELEYLDDQSYKRIIELYSPYSKKVQQENNSIYYNGVPTTDENVTGIIFSLYDTYSLDNNNIELYVFEVKD